MNEKKTLIIGLVCVILLSGIGLQTGADEPAGPTGPMNSVQFQGCIVDLPTDPVTMSVYYSLGYSQFIVTLSNVPTGYDIVKDFGDFKTVH